MLGIRNGRQPQLDNTLQRRPHPRHPGLRGIQAARRAVHLLGPPPRPFLVGRGYYERRLQSIAVSVLIVVVYGGMIAGVLPRDDRGSWEAHLFGLLAGGLCARSARRSATFGTPP